MFEDGSYYLIVMFGFVLYFPIQAGIAWLFLIPCIRINRKKSAIGIAIGFALGPLILSIIGVTLLLQLLNIFDFNPDSEYLSIILGIAATFAMSTVPIFYIRKWSRQWNDQKFDNQ